MAEDYLKYISDIPTFSLHEMMREFGQEVWNYAFVLTKNHHMSDDVTQDVFLQAYLNINSFRGQSSLRTWLFSITRNTAYNYKKSAFIRRVTLLGFNYPINSVRSAEDQYLNRTFTDSIWKLVLKLPEKYREVLLLDAKYEMPLAEIAAFLQLSIGTVKSRLHRAKNKMKTLLGEVD